MHGQAVRCGPLAQAARVFSATLGGGREGPCGPAGLMALARAVERHLDRSDSDEEADRLFVELAGGYLAVLLCESLGEGHHAVRDGKHGLVLESGAFFDPFAVITRLLRAEHVRRALAQEVARVEMRARSKPQPQAADSLLRAQILPRLVGPAFSAFLDSRAHNARVHLVPLLGEVRLAFIVREGRGARYVREDELERVNAAHLRRAALENLARKSEHARLIRCDSDQGVLVVAKTGDGLDSSRLLLPGLHDVLAPELGSPFAAAVPHRDALFACSLASDSAVQDLRERASHEAGRAAHRITPQLFGVGPAGALRAL